MIILLHTSLQLFNKFFDIYLFVNSVCIYLEEKFIFFFYLDANWKNRFVENTRESES